MGIESNKLGGLGASFQIGAQRAESTHATLAPKVGSELTAAFQNLNGKLVGKIEELTAHQQVQSLPDLDIRYANRVGGDEDKLMLNREQETVTLSLVATPTKADAADKAREELKGADGRSVPDQAEEAFDKWRTNLQDSIPLLERESVRSDLFDMLAPSRRSDGVPAWLKSELNKAAKQIGGDNAVVANVTVDWDGRSGNQRLNFTVSVPGLKETMAAADERIRNG